MYKRQELSETLAHEHDRASLLVGADLSGAEDTIADILIEMASTETLPRSEALAEGMIEELLFELGSVNAKPIRKAGFLFSNPLISRQFLWRSAFCQLKVTWII